MNSINRILCSTLILTSLVGAHASANEDRTKKDLSEIQNALEQSQAERKAQQKKISSLKKKLKQHELAIAKNAKALNIAENSIEETQQKQRQQQQKADVLKDQQTQMQQALAAQLKSAYMADNGGHNYTKLLLNQDNTAQVERTLSYYNYLNKARTEQLDELKLLLIEIEKIQAELQQTKQHLIALHEEQKDRQQALLSAQQERQENLKSLSAKLNSTNSSINYLKENEQTLKATLVELEKARNQKVELLGLSKNKGKLDWPTKGKLSHKFGQRKHGGIDWKGVVITASEGTDIKSIDNGQVVYADWLNGFGWVIVIDHGDGFMSLYGHTQTLLKDVGDTVRQGESVALVGKSGGQANAGLYFEIRHKGRAVNPQKWCKHI